ncbi:MAG TPA: MG2 domain-containing protein, partial [Gammaproteobacteria bacterium]
MSRRSLALRASATAALLALAGISSADTQSIATPSGAVQVLRITPSGQVESAQRQVVIQFDRPMVVLGAAPPKLDSVPVDIAPALDCSWHWVNTSTLACELGEHRSKPGTPGYARFGYQVEQGGFAPATSYKVTVHAGIKATDGNELEKDATEEFETERPRAQYGYLREWSGPTEPVIQVSFDLPVTRSSVEAHLFFPTTAGRVPVSAMADPHDRRDFYVLPGGGGAPVHVDGQLAGASQDEGGDEGDGDGEDGAPTPEPDASTIAAAPAAAVPAGEQARYQWLVAVRSGAKLPGGETVQLLQEPGLVTPLGPEPGDHDGEVGRGIVTYGEPLFLGVTCGEDQHVYLDDPAKPAASPKPNCDPQRYVSLAFSVPVKKDELEAHFTAKVNGKSVDPIGEIPDAGRWGYERYEDSHFNVFFQTPLKSDSDYTVQMTAGMKDVWGRPMQQGGSAGFHINHRQPALDLQEHVAVLEKGVDSDVPLYFTNLDKLTANYKRLSLAKSGADNVDSTSYDYKLPEVRDLSVGIPLGVRGLLDGRSGVVSGTLVPTPLPDRGYYGGEDPYRFFAQVTPFHVVAKLGHFDTLVWVTDLATGQPVAGARIRIFPATPEDFAEIPQDAASAITDADGMAHLPGGVTLDPDLSLRQPHYGQDRSRVLVVRVDRGQDLALLPLDYTFQVDTYSASHYQVEQRLRRRFGHMHAWGTTAEGIYRAGDTIQYKLFVRDQDGRRFVLPPDVEYTVTLEDPMGNVVDKHPDVKLSPFGGYAGEYKVPETAPVGWYSFHVTTPGAGSSEDDDSGTLTPMRVLVSDFTPAPFHVDTSLNGASFQPGAQVQVTTTARLHSGGPYTGAQGRNTVTLKAEDFRPAAPALADFTFASYDAQLNQRDQTVNETEGGVDDQGVLKTGFELQDAGIYYGKLLVEGDVRDERGKYIAAVTRADYLGRDRFVGLRMNQWVLNAEQPASVQYVVTDGSGKAIAGTGVDIAVERMELKASRVKGPGNAYLTQYARSWVAAGGCKADSTAQPAACQFTPPQPGSYRIRASIKDTQGREHQSSLPAWVIGKGQVLWENHDDGALTIVPERSEYHVGDHARYLVQNPYPGAKALISIERYGVLKSWVQTLEGSTPVIDFPVEQDYVPGFYLSITVVSPRVAKPLGPDQVDLGKPAFMTGYLTVPVVDDYKALDIKVTTPRDAYKPRDTVNVDVDVKARHGNAGNVELAVAVLDDSVFDLVAQGKDYFDPYKGFYSLDGLDLQSYDLILRLVGRQSFEKKGATPGGDGGAAVSLRSLFKFVSYWNPALGTDAKGHARFSFQVPDNLTAWRVLVVAVNQGDRMGLGQGT